MGDRRAGECGMLSGIEMNGFARKWVEECYPLTEPCLLRDPTCYTTVSFSMLTEATGVDCYAFWPCERCSLICMETIHKRGSHLSGRTPSSSTLLFPVTLWARILLASLWMQYRLTPLPEGAAMTLRPIVMRNQDMLS